MVIKQLKQELNINEKQIKEVLNLFKEGATIPFIARYRKELTGGLNEEVLRKIEEKHKYFVNLMERKETVIKLIDEKGMLTEELKNKILACTKLVDVEDLYLPFKEGRKTKATDAIKMGLEPLAKKIMTFPNEGSLDEIFSSSKVSKKEAEENTKFIISQWISEDAQNRNFIRRYIFKTGFLETNIKKDAKDEKKVYEMYYDFNEKINSAKSHRVLAINRAEKEKVLNVKLKYDQENIFEKLKQKVIKNDSFVNKYVKNAIEDALKRLIYPSVEREIRKELTEKSEEDAIEIFKLNLENLLMARPISNNVILGFDPAFRTGCKLAVLDISGKVLAIDIIYPHEPQNDIEGSKKKILELIKKHNINLIAIGNGTASRESEIFIAEIIKDLKDVFYTIVNEAGASVYSASKEAAKEFPNLNVEERSAVSIGRRVTDPLSELVKIDPKSIGVGEYQHDVNAKKLTESLDFTVSKVVNNVGVNINTASTHILKYISGLRAPIIKKIISHKEKTPFKSREELKKITSKKVFEQAAGFLRINNGQNKLDETGIHPESYDLTNDILKFLDLDINDINTKEFKEKLNKTNKEILIQEFNTDKYTVEDIINELLNPGLDPREKVDPPILRSDILKLTDLKEGMELKGTVRNVASFGAFIDIGLENDGLVHISKMSNKFVNNPSDIVSVGDIITCYVHELNLEKEKVSLSLLKK